MGRVNAHRSPSHDRILVSAGLVWLAGDELLFGRRSAGAKHGAGLLELPGGKIEPGESPKDAVARELVEEWGQAATCLRVGPVADVLHHVYPEPGLEVVLCVYHVNGCALDGGRWRRVLTPEPGSRIEAYCPEDLPIDQFLAADRGFLTRIRAAAVISPFGRSAAPGSSSD